VIRRWSTFTIEVSLAEVAAGSNFGFFTRFTVLLMAGWADDMELGRMI
jgi:hypothetical protein